MNGAPLSGRSIGFIGLGRMGSAMAGRILEHGAALTVYNRTTERCTGIVERGAAAVSTPAEVARRSDVVISMVADGPALLNVALDKEGVMAGASPGLTYIDMSTVSPSESRQVAKAAEAAGVGYLRAPVTGTTFHARSGTLGVLASGPRDRYDAVLDVLGSMSTAQWYVGGSEEARVLKLALNTMVATTMAAFAEALVLGEKAGLNWRTMLEVIAGSAVGSPFVKVKSSTLGERTYQPAATPGLMMKDLVLALGTAQSVGATMPLTAATCQLLQQMEGIGLGDRDFSGLVLLLEQLSGLPPEQQ